MNILSYFYLWILGPFEKQTSSYTTNRVKKRTKEYLIIGGYWKIIENVISCDSVVSSPHKRSVFLVDSASTSISECYQILDVSVEKKYANDVGELVYYRVWTYSINKVMSLLTQAWLGMYNQPYCGRAFYFTETNKKRTQIFKINPRSKCFFDSSYPDF